MEMGGKSFKNLQSGAPRLFSYKEQINCLLSHIILFDTCLYIPYHLTYHNKSIDS